jgi:DNA repair protein RecN (Recombination protein N)
LLASLTIRNFVLIEDATLEFGPGLAVLTGETGAGKTLLTRALGLLMGERAEDGLVGGAAEDAYIQAIFDLGDAELTEISPDLRALAGIEESGELIITRRLGKQGRNRCYINDTAVTLGTMAALIGGLLSFAGQHEYRRLLDPRYQLAVLDEWAGAPVVELASAFRGSFESAREAGRRLEEGRRVQETRLREIDLLRFQVAELAKAGLSVEEEKSLLGEQRLLSRAEEILRSAGAAAHHLRNDSDEPDAGILVARAGAQLAGLVGVDQSLDAIIAAVSDVQHQITEVARDLHGYLENIAVDQARLQVVDDRLRLYTDLIRKYGGSTGVAVAHLAQATERLAALENVEEDLARLEKARAAQAARALELAATLTDARRKAAPLLEQAVNAQLADLGMVSAALHVDLRSHPGWDGLRQTGADTVELLLAANPGQPPRSLSRTASGGELSRALLAVKCALAGAGGRETLVFDEIDAGIGGRTAVSVARKLRELASRSQLIVVTHLARVAALADRHYLIDKSTDSGGTVTRLVLLSGETVVDELCRMMGGRPDDTEAMAHARELRDRATDRLLD